MRLQRKKRVEHGAGFFKPTSGRKGDKGKKNAFSFFQETREERGELYWPLSPKEIRVG